jgi:hypothetical protein
MSKTATCLICQSEWQLHPARKADHLFCQDCRKTEKRIDYGHEEPCVPWHGEFDDDDNPLRMGRPYRPGERTCGHKDCVQKSHIVKVITPEELEAERWSIYYRTGQRRNYDQLITAVKKESQAA